MKKLYSVGIIVLIILSVVLLSGCTSTKVLNLGKALNKSANVRSQSMDTKLTFFLDPTQSYEINLNSKFHMFDTTSAAISAQLSSNILGQSIKGEMYMDAQTDYTKDNFIVKLPVGLGLPIKFDNKYLVFTGKDAMSLDKSFPVIDVKKHEEAQRLSKDLAALLIKYIKADITGYNDVEEIPNVNVKNIEGSFDTTKYTLSINNDTLKKLLITT